VSDTISSNVKKLALFLASAAFALLAGCGKQGSEAEPPANFRVVPGDASVIVSWDAEPDVDYWIFFGTGTDITTDNWANRNGVAIPGATSPRIITGLRNGVTYSFTINGRKDRGPGGPGAPTQVAVPMVAGSTWAPGTPLGTASLNSIAAGTIITGFGVAAVGDGGAIFSGVNALPLTPAATVPSGTTNLTAVWHGLFRFFAGGPNGTLLESLDGITWVARTSGTTATIYGGTTSLTNTVVGVASGGVVLTSTDGTSWSTQNSGTNNDLYAVTYGAQRFVAVGALGTMIVSTDGSNWGEVNDFTDRDLRGVAFGAIPSTEGSTVVNTYVAVGAGGTVLTSIDGIGWTVLPPFTTVNLTAVTYGGRFVAVGEGGAIFTSINGTDWEVQSSGTTQTLRSVVRQLSGYTAVGDQGTNVSTF
jgi:hypothetical protein